MKSEVDNLSSRISGEELKKELITLTRDLGFDSCRVAACAPPPHVTQFQDWLRQGAAGEMSYMQRGEENRCDPQKILPSARSVIVVALNYFQGDVAYRATATEGATGRIARYAWGDDYHNVMAINLDKIDNFLRGFGGRQKCYVDTGPILERDHAARAGIGWHGKSTMLIDPRLGTWFFLGEILTTLELASDSPQPDRCGKCERCINACPTGAITAPHRLDARRCISYLTIELKGSIPPELRSLIGNRIFGCDDCLDACPWNRFASVSRESAFSARQSTTGMSLRDYLKLTDAEFRELFKNSPIKRIKRRGFLRNVCVALGNVGDLADLPALKRAASDPDGLIAEHATWAIKRIQRRCGTPVPKVC
ncbi:MAG: tRNA epoxyqueuosine(34) reductase QueG [Verrucomicrobia bacterium]|nr:MAG: tRNA epoxyqueuosine(34) reductase QueG [Verrucomicrobiota bacterium]